MDIESRIDRISFDILNELANNGRLSNKELAAGVQLAPSTTHERLKHLRASGVYGGAHADVDLRKLGFEVEALVQIGLAKQKRKAVVAFVTSLRSLVEVRQFFIVTGAFDVIVHLSVRDMEHLRSVAYDLTASPIVERIETSVIYERWRQHALPAPSWLKKEGGSAPGGRPKHAPE